MFSVFRMFACTSMINFWAKVNHRGACKYLQSLDMKYSAELSSDDDNSPNTDPNRHRGESMSPLELNLNMVLSQCESQIDIHARQT